GYHHAPLLRLLSLVVIGGVVWPAVVVLTASGVAPRGAASRRQRTAFVHRRARHHDAPTRRTRSIAGHFLGRHQQAISCATSRSLPHHPRISNFVCNESCNAVMAIRDGRPRRSTANLSCRANLCCRTDRRLADAVLQVAPG